MTAGNQGFSGSYCTGDVRFLLKPVSVDFVGVGEKERQIQNGSRHYSEMLAREAAPSEAYMKTFRDAFATNRARVGRDVASLARVLAARPGREVVLVSLARAGTPVGILLLRALRALTVATVHYSVSIIRGRGVDVVAMRRILRMHDAADVVFVDGWTGKGAIANELRGSLAATVPELADAPLCVLSDLAGVADFAAGDDDYVIPSAILNGIISGLVSRTILRDDLIGPDDFHGCVALDDLVEHDLSQWYVNEQMKDVRSALANAPAATWGAEARARAAVISAAFVDTMLAQTGARDRNRVKPGIGESTRALLRRLPDRLFVRDAESPDVRHLLRLAADRGLTPDIDPQLPYRACAIIKTLGAG